MDDVTETSNPLATKTSGSGQDVSVLWSVVICYFNEEDFILRTLACVSAQRGVSFKLILVNNASTDKSEDICRDYFKAAPEIDVRFVDESRPGHAFALETGYSAVDTPYVSFWDADTWYPGDYLATAQDILESKNCAAAMAIDIYSPPTGFQARLQRWRMKITSHILKNQAHTGTFGQNFKMAALKAAGGPSSAQWPYVLDDHELIHRILKIGKTSYDTRLWCMPLPRRTNNAHVRWTLYERLMYHVTPFRLKDWFFYSFLKKRFEKRRLYLSNLRDRDW
jgi:glycosyltransferase involved in cell wall biosynthesis